MKFTKNNLKENIDSTSHQKFYGGGEKKKCNILNHLSQNVGINTTPVGEDLVKQSYDLDKNFICYSQFDPRYTNNYDVLNPEFCSLKDIENHALVIQELSPTTVKSRIRLIKKMANHPIVPIDFNHPTPQTFSRYMNYIKVEGDYDRYGRLKPVGKHGLKNRRLAWYMCEVAWGFDDIWPKYKIRKIPDRSRDIQIPNPDTVRAMLHYKYVNNRDLNRLIQYYFFFGFFIGMAPEKEFIILDVNDVIIDKYGNNTIRITRPKVGNKSRILRIEKTIATSPVYKSVLNYLKYIRPKFSDVNEKALFVDPRTGQRWKDADTLRRFLTKFGKMVYPAFFPYLMRHWCGTARMIEWKKTDTALAKVNYWLGHTKLDQTKKYVDFAFLFHDDDGSWLSRALKRGFHGGLHEGYNVHKSEKRSIIEQKHRIRGKIYRRVRYS
jgi:hypothetical protein